MCVRIIVDSSTNVSEKYREKIQSVPLTVRFGDKEYLDGVELSKHQFYEMLVESDVLPTTSQATPAAFADCFEAIASAGDSAVVITLPPSSPEPTRAQFWRRRITQISMWWTVSPLPLAPACWPSMR